MNGATSTLPVPVGTVYSGANQKPTVTVTYNSETTRNFTIIWEAHYYTAGISAGSYKPIDEFVKAGDYQGKVVLNGLGSTTPAYGARFIPTMARARSLTRRTSACIWATTNTVKTEIGYRCERSNTDYVVDIDVTYALPTIPDLSVAGEHYIIGIKAGGSGNFATDVTLPFAISPLELSKAVINIPNWFLGKKNEMKLSKSTVFSKIGNCQDCAFQDCKVQPGQHYPQRGGARSLERKELQGDLYGRACGLYGGDCEFGKRCRL
ncbi:hypothetical protein Barb6_03761 [Bacteroidales bacterium Barb6]|nr:hypothetical protein Barb6_03761 [Bacteroidales bacterium Barb6]